MNKDKDEKKTKKAEESEQTVSTEESTDVEAKPEKKETKKEKKDKKADEIKQLKEELENQKESYVRLCAEYDNYRKRTSNEKLSIYDDATAKAVEQLLPVADSLEMAMKNTEGAPEEFTKGIELVQNQLLKSFEKLKIEPFTEIGDDFNPEIHNAISKIESEDFKENKISQIFQKGYKIGDKIVRHAMVQVANCD